MKKSFLSENQKQTLIDQQKIQKSTCEKYCRNLKHVFQNVFDLDNFQAFKLETNYKDVIDYCNSLASDTRRDYIISSLLAYKYLHGSPKKEIIEAYEKAKELICISCNNQRRNKQTHKGDEYRTQEDLEKSRNIAITEYQSDKENPILAMKYRLAWLYSHPDLAPLRSQDWAMTKMVDAHDTSEENQLVVSSNELILYHGKTQTKTKTFRVVKVPKEVMLALLESKQSLDDTNWVIPKSSTELQKQADDTSYMGKMLKAIFGISSNALRQNYVSKLVDNNYPLDQFMERSIEMGHNLSTALEYYTQLSKKSLFNKNDEVKQALEQRDKTIDSLSKELENLKTENLNQKSVIDALTLSISALGTLMS